MKNKLILKDVFSTDVDVPLEKWEPINDEIYISLSIDVAFSDDLDSVMYFYAVLCTPEGLLAKKKLLKQNKMIVKNRTMVIGWYDYDLLLKTIKEILRKCTRNTAGESYLALERYFQWEYEDYGIDVPM